MRQFLDLVERIVMTGKKKGDPQGVGNLAVLGHQMRFNLQDGFPLITTRSLKGSWRTLVEELLWFLSGSSSIKDLNERNVHLWDRWATEECCSQFGLETGDLGRIYGPQWRRWGKRGGGFIDQIAKVVDEIKRSPDSRRLMVTSWNPEDVDRVFVAPCHCMFKFFVADGEISLHLFQRSADVLVGVPFNIAEYALLLLIMAQVTGFRPKDFVHTLSDAHIYLDQIPFANEQLSRQPKSLPKVQIDSSVKDIFAFRFEHFSLAGYDPHPAISGIPVAI